MVIKNPMTLIVKSRGVTPVSWPNSLHTGPFNQGLLIIPIHLIGSMSLSSPPVAGVWWAHWRRCPVAAVASSKWMLHTGGGWGETPHMIVKRFGCTTIHNKALHKCLIHSFIQWMNEWMNERTLAPQPYMYLIRHVMLNPVRTYRACWSG